MEGMSLLCRKIDYILNSGVGIVKILSSQTVGFVIFLNESCWFSILPDPLSHSLDAKRKSIMKPADAQKEGSPAHKLFKQRYFMARELQFSIALIIVLALLGGIFLQAVSSALISYWGLETTALGFFLIIGYILLVVLLAVFFTHRLIGPFKRLEYEMKLIQAGNLAKRLSIRSQDDLHVRKFVKHINSFVSRFQEMSGEYNRLNSTVMTKLDMISEELSRGNADCPRLKKEIDALLKEVREFREKW